ncbi:Uncharacterized conserved protein [Catalinimonas alkaloidigena]|uniref:Uncharacterized conserved protein n=1 Tax=Catalinimonas alkaloidigena TaxID=1075417 RepID=A0A1G9ULS3_9BACT|nr:hypothetical protein [Catalinimonas alkaloidigena]SDM60807.1 Uncharacterized conserved protein [Catalinimonas alkaloidigena]
MKHSSTSALLSGLVVLLPLLQACTDVCESTTTYTVYEPVFTMAADLKTSIGYEAPRDLHEPGKIYRYGDYLLVNELHEGLHIFDNKDPQRPVNLKFLAIPGNVDMALRDGILYADNYVDLVAIDLTDPLAARVTERIPNVFAHNYNWAGTDSTLFISDWQETEQVKLSDCQEAPWNNGQGWREGDGIIVLFGGFANTKAYSSSGAAPQVGVAGSMARFAQYDRYLYTVGPSDMRLYDVSTPTTPVPGPVLNVGFGVETIFAYKDMLYLGSSFGMYIYDNSDPRQPVQLGQYPHVLSCDPVVVQDDYAYVTLRSGSLCGVGAWTDQLMVIDVRKPSNPTLLKTYPMTNPHGLSIDGCNLFICEGTDGLKTFKTTDPEQLELVQHLTGMDAYDVIAYDDLLIMIGKDGLYQYTYTDFCQQTAALQPLSVIPVKRPAS